jgi:hypothetical protein
MSIAESLLPEFEQEMTTTRRLLERVPSDQTISHLVHHRGQLTVYLRLLDIPIPSIYGPTADERM